MGYVAGLKECQSLNALSQLALGPMHWRAVFARLLPLAAALENADRGWRGGGGGGVISMAAVRPLGRADLKRSELSAGLRA